MKRIEEYAKDEISEVMWEVGHSLSKAAKKLGVKKRDLALKMAELTMEMEPVSYAYDDSTWKALTCPHCNAVGPPVIIEDPSEYSYLAYGGKMDSKAIAGLHFYGECGACHKAISLVYEIVEMRTGEASAEVAERLAKSLIERMKDK